MGLAEAVFTKVQSPGKFCRLAFVWWQRDEPGGWGVPSSQNLVRGLRWGP